jgi:hypothetical protein
MSIQKTTNRSRCRQHRRRPKTWLLRQNSRGGETTLILPRCKCLQKKPFYNLLGLRTGMGWHGQLARPVGPLAQWNGELIGHENSLPKKSGRVSPFRAAGRRSEQAGRLCSELGWGGTGNLPVPSGHWPNGTGSRLAMKIAFRKSPDASLRSERRVAARNRRVACATQHSGCMPFAQKTRASTWKAATSKIGCTLGP